MRAAWIVVAFAAGTLLGLVVGTVMLNSTPGPASLLSYEPAPGGRQEILVLVGLGRLDSVNFVEAQEDASAVRVNVSIIHWRGTAPADMKMVFIPVPLQGPLGSRSVLDGSGQPIPLRR
jgi:hypothetical protein